MARIDESNMGQYWKDIPGVRDAITAVWAALRAHSRLDPVLREMVRLRSAQMTNCQH